MTLNKSTIIMINYSLLYILYIFVNLIFYNLLSIPYYKINILKDS